MNFRNKIKKWTLCEKQGSLLEEGRYGKWLASKWAGGLRWPVGNEGEKLISELGRPRFLYFHAVFRKDAFYSAFLVSDRSNDSFQVFPKNTRPVFLDCQKFIFLFYKKNRARPTKKSPSCICTDMTRCLFVGSSQNHISKPFIFNLHQTLSS